MLKDIMLFHYFETQKNSIVDFHTKDMMRMQQCGNVVFCPLANCTEME